MVRLVKHFLRIFFTGSSFLLFFCGGTVLALLVLPLVYAFTRGGPAEKQAACREWVSESWIFFHDYMAFWGLISYRAQHLSMPLPDGPLVVVANHPTLVDVTAVISAWGRLVCVAKPEHFSSPLIGQLLRFCGYIRGGDSSLFAKATVVTNSVEALRGGAAILVFPEGTRSPMNGLREFRRGAFEMAVRANAPILPVFITCNPPTLMRGQPWYDVPERQAELTITPLPMILPPHGDPEQMARAMTEDYRARLDAFLAQRALPAKPEDEPRPAAKAG